MFLVLNDTVSFMLENIVAYVFKQIVRPVHFGGYLVQSASLDNHANIPGLSSK